MSDVKRYDWHTDVGCMIEEPDGGFVEAADYYTLLADRAALDSLCQERFDEIAQLRAELAAIRGQEAVATLLPGDPCDERPGFYLSLKDKQRLADLPGGTKLFALPPDQPAPTPPHQVVGRVHHNEEHSEPVRSVLNSIGRQLPDGAPLFAGMEREVFRYHYRHPGSGEAHVLEFTKEEVRHNLCDTVFECLIAKICQCESVGETNVVNCRCDEYAEEFVEVHPPKKTGHCAQPGLAIQGPLRPAHAFRPGLVEELRALLSTRPAEGGD